MLLQALIVSSLIGFTYTRYFIVGPPALKILDIAPCKNINNTIMQLELTKQMFNQTTQLLTGSYNVFSDIGDNITMDVKCSRIDKKKVQVNSFVLNSVPVCSTLLKYVGDLWLFIQNAVGMEPGVCPIKTGNYTVRNMVLDLEKLNVRMILEGQFTTRIVLKNGTKPVFCEDFNLELYPKK